MNIFFSFHKKQLPVWSFFHYSTDNKNNNYKENNNEKDDTFKNHSSSCTENVQHLYNDLQAVHPFLRETGAAWLTWAAGLLSRL